MDKAKAFGGMLVCCWFLAFAGPAHAFIIKSFTGDNLEIEVTIADIAGGGITASFDITDTSPETGDITGAFLSFDDLLFDSSLINAGSEVTNFEAFLADGTDVSTSVAWSASLVPDGTNPLPGEAGLALQFDLDLGVTQNKQRGGNVIVDKLVFDITESTLSSNVVNAAGARIQTSTGNAGSSKLVGGGVSVPEPGTLALLAIGLLVLSMNRVFAPRRVSANNQSATGSLAAVGLPT